MLYKEKDDKLSLVVPATDESVKLCVTCFNGTTVSVAFSFLGPKEAMCGDDVQVGVAQTVLGNKRSYNGAGNNALAGNFKVEHVFTAPNGKQLTYVFPDDYTGVKPYDPADKNPDYRFIVNFKGA